MTANKDTFNDSTKTLENSELTIAELVCPLKDPRQRQLLEEYRIRFEAAHGPTDLTKNYVTMWSIERAEWLLANDPKRYWESMPPFAQAFVKMKCKLAVKEGKLDDAPTAFATLFVQGHMKLALD